MLIGLQKNSHRTQAFSVVEIMVAVVVVTILFIGLFGGMSQGFSLCAVARERLRANQIALERMEGLRLVKWSDLTNTTLVPATFQVLYDPTSGSSGVLYRGTMTIANVNMSPSPSYASQMKKVTVQVNWTAGRVSHTHTVSTYVSKYGMQKYIYEN